MRKLIACLLVMMMVMGMSPVYAKNIKKREGLNYQLKPMKLSFDDTPYVSHGKSKRKRSAPSGYHYFYDQLDQNGKNIYMAFSQMAQSATKGSKVPFTLDLSDNDFSSDDDMLDYVSTLIYDAEFAVALDQPQFLTLYINLFDPLVDNDDPSDDPVALSEITYDSNYDTVTSAVYYTDDCTMYTSQENTLKEKANSYFADHDIDTNQPDAVVAKEIHDTLIKKVTYDDEAAKKSDSLPLDIAHTAYGSLVDGEAVCDGYSLGYEYLCTLANIKSTVVYGAVGYDKDDLEGHAWNEVYLSGKWYELDTTWDDEGTSPIYTYYNITTDQIDELDDNGDIVYHVRDSDGTGPYLPTATGTHFTARYMNYDTAEISNAKDTLGNRVDHYNKVNDTYKTLSDSRTYDQWSIHICNTSTNHDDEYVWKESTTVSDDLTIDTNWTDHVLKLSRKDDSTASTASLSTKVIFDNGQYTTIDSSLDLLKWTSDQVIIKNATCTADGEKGIYDESGTYVLINSIESLPALGHNYGDWEQYNETQHKRVCKNDSSHVDYKDHNFETKVTKEPTCTGEGSETYTCKTCGYSYTKTVSALGHNYSQYQTLDVNDAYYTTKHYVVCSLCGDKKDEDHEFTSVVTTAPTCTSEGVRTYTCKDCGYSYMESIPALGHTYGGWTIENATTHVRYCLRDHDAQREAHHFDGGVVTKKSTTRKAGTKVYTCADCGYQKTVKLAKLKGIVVVTNKKVKLKGSKVTTKTKTVTLKTHGLKGKKIWRVSNKKIAKVKNGKVTFKKKGKVTVTLKCGKKKYKVTITYKK